MVVPLVMGLSVSILSATTTIFISAGCFAFGYLIAINSRLDTLKERNDDDDDDDDDNSSNRRSILSWAQAMVQKVTPRARIMADDRTPNQTKHKRPATLQIETLAEILQDFKMVLVVRNDLKMGKGKIAAQCSHATLGLYKKLLNRAPKSLSRWEMCGQVKVVLKIESEEDLLVLQERAKSLNLPTHITIDAGRTQIAPNSRTVMAILGPADVVDDVTGGLKLL